jgi:hypothetical protein
VLALSGEATPERCAESLLLLDASISSILVRAQGPTSLRSLRDALREVEAIAFAPALARWLDSGSPIVAYLWAVHNWCAGILPVARRGGALRWRKTEHAAAQRSAAYVLEVVQPACSHLQKLCTDANLRAALWPTLPARMVSSSPRPGTKRPAPPPLTRPLRLVTPRDVGGPPTLPTQGAEHASDELLRDLWARAERLQAEIVALNWELSPELGDSRTTPAAE